MTIFQDNAELAATEIKAFGAALRNEGVASARALIDAGRPQEAALSMLASVETQAYIETRVRFDLHGARLNRSRAARGG